MFHHKANARIYVWNILPCKVVKSGQSGGIINGSRKRQDYVYVKWEYWSTMWKIVISNTNELHEILRILER